MLMCVSTQLKRAFAYIYTPVRRHSYAYYVRILINVFFSVIEGTWVRSNEKLRVVCIIWKVMNTKNQYTVSTGWNFSYIYLTLTHYERLLWKYIFLVQYFVTINTIKKGIRHLWEIQKFHTWFAAVTKRKNFFRHPCWNKGVYYMAV